MLPSGRWSRSRGLLFFRLIEQALAILHPCAASNSSAAYNPKGLCWGNNVNSPNLFSISNSLTFRRAIGVNHHLVVRFPGFPPIRGGVTEVPRCESPQPRQGDSFVEVK